MNYEGDSFSSESANLQAQIDALKVRMTAAEGKITTLQSSVSTLQTQMTGALADIATLKTGVFTGRVQQFTNRHTPFMVGYSTDEVTILNNMATYEFLTPVTTQIRPFYADGATFYFHTNGTLNGSPLSLSFAMCQEFSSPLGGVSLPITAATGTPNYFVAEAMLQVTDYAPPNMNIRFVLWVTLNGSVAGSVSASGVAILTTDLDTIWLGKIDTTPATTVTRMQGFVQNLQ